MGRFIRARGPLARIRFGLVNGPAGRRWAREAEDAGVTPEPLIAQGIDLCKLDGGISVCEAAAGIIHIRAAGAVGRRVSLTNAGAGIVAHFIGIAICPIYEHLLPASAAAGHIFLFMSAVWASVSST